MDRLTGIHNRKAFDGHIKELIDQNAIAEFIESLDVSQNIKDELLQITPENYTGIIDF